MNSVLTNINPKQYLGIANRDIFLLIKKGAPKEVPFKAYIYESLGEHHNCRNCNDFSCCLRSMFGCNEGLGMVVGEFICDRVEKFESEFWDDDTYERIKHFYESDDPEEDPQYCFTTVGEDGKFTNYNLGKKSGYSWADLRKYIGTGIKTFYAWHISKLIMYQQPKELSDFKRPLKSMEKVMDPDYPQCSVCDGCEYASWEDGHLENCSNNNCSFAIFRTPPKIWYFCEEIKTCLE